MINIISGDSTMKMILTSKGFTTKYMFSIIQEKLDKPIEQVKILFIPTALFGKNKEEKLLKGLINLGFNKDNIICFNHLEVEKYRNLNLDVIYGCGGNTFLLLKLIKESGFDKDIIQYVKNGVIYIGASAGTHLVTKNIEHILEIDCNEVGLTDFKGLGLFDRIIFCHYCEERQTVNICGLPEVKFTYSGDSI